MRHRRITQLSLFHPRAVDHPLGDELERMSGWLDERPELLDWVAADLGGRPDGVGRQGLSCETVLRCAVLKHVRQETFRGLAFLLVDSRSAQRFARAEALRPPGKSALQATVGSVRAETWERINRLLLASARELGVESGERVRVDSTVTHSHILAPSDSRLLYDGVRVLTRLLGQARAGLGSGTVFFRDHRRAAKRRALEIGSQRGRERRAKTYRRLLKLVERTRGYASSALAKVESAGEGEACWQSWRRKVEECDELLGRVVGQTRRRVLAGEKVPAQEKVVSLFEPHADIIVKGGRGTQYGHKLNLATGRSGLVLDMVVEDGNPADSSRCLPMLERHVARWGAAPTHAAFDGGYASRGNLKAAKALGVRHAVFQKRKGLKDGEMSPSARVRRELRRFRAGVEAGISCLKRCFGLGLCRWRGLPAFKAYVQSAVFAHNLVRLARLLPGPG